MLPVPGISREGQQPQKKQPARGQLFVRILSRREIQLTASVSLLPGLNLATVFAGILIMAPVRGFFA